jgi:hypothetical protein
MSRSLEPVIASLLEEHPSAKVVFSPTVTRDGYVLNVTGEIPVLYVHPTHTSVIRGERENE